MLILKNNLGKKSANPIAIYLCSTSICPDYFIFKNNELHTFTMLSGIGKSVVDWPKFYLCTVMSVEPWHWNGCWFLSDCLSEIHDIKDIVQE